ncbi:uncharacterized protein L969DRAFT_101824 [Mixia osmundae IAM 14324]|uniref:Rab-GAP TBC domain-containing protein n=1 Tax=Mixia osmundae (strain CBS 9802 / IAM 14324 / JCM 22182 / KY 12970) TaxID=764103 RepID=G7DYS2_MIXOS|nr:uncharacterized protein L969DRAFT_101824 [Mixia osmundae IAM 14324]KEI41631.1 hypothetical protein L969DRAFT_101824 [Mixia osmundae IAM 14324]GAA95732.1 hypothetical protein E5Q_02389 [Mixia osmundae IAM 14324]
MTIESEQHAKLELFAKLHAQCAPSAPQDDRLELYSYSHLCAQGVPDSHRATAWRILLGLLPADKSRWQAEIKSKREAYYDFVQDLGVKIAAQPPPDLSKALSREDAWLDQIDKDIQRTQLALDFFAQPVAACSGCPLTSRLPLRRASQPEHTQNHRRAVFERIAQLSSGLGYRDKHHSPRAGSSAHFAQNGNATEAEDRHWEVLERLLYIFAQLNPGLGYVQGMADVLSPLYFAIARPPTVHQERSSIQVLAGHAEADTFWCFNHLMGELSDCFNESLDGDVIDTKSSAAKSNATVGIGYILRKFDAQLRWQDSDLADALASHGITSSYYAFQWIVSLFAQCFRIPDILSLWDRLFALIPARPEQGHAIENGLSPFLAHVVDICCAMITLKRDVLIGDATTFEEALRLLQRYQYNDVATLVLLAGTYRERRLTASISGQGPDDVLARDNLQDGLSLAKARLAAVSSTARSRLFGTSQASSTPEISVSPSPMTAASGLFKRYADAFQRSDTAASLSKATTNLRAQAPGAIQKLRDDMTTSYKGLGVTLDTTRNGLRRASVQSDQPFVPPDHANGRASPIKSVASGQLQSEDKGNRRVSNSKPRPLLLSSSARAADSPSPGSSRRSSYQRLSPRSPSSPLPGSAFLDGATPRSPSPYNPLTHGVALDDDVVEKSEQELLAEALSWRRGRSTTPQVDEDEADDSDYRVPRRVITRDINRQYAMGTQPPVRKASDSTSARVPISRRPAIKQRASSLEHNPQAPDSEGSEDSFYDSATQHAF